MTEAEKQSLIEHLAEKVCGWTPVCQPEGWWDGVEGGIQRLIGIDEFDPLADANDCSLIMEAWAATKHSNLTICWTGSAWTCGASNAASIGTVDQKDHVMSWPEAVCLAIARAGGWEGSK